MSVSTFTQPDFTSQDATTYKTSIDDGFSVFSRVIAAFAPHEQDTPNMTVRLDAGFVPQYKDVPLEVAAQDTGTITAPTIDPRIDIVYVDRQTGVVGVQTGEEDADPSDPAIPDNKVAVARVTLATDTASITNSLIDDIRTVPFGEGSAPAGVKMYLYNQIPGGL